MTARLIVALPGIGVVPSDSPILLATDLGALRGDGVFEAAHVRDGRPWLLAEHLDRMARSAGRLGLDLPPSSELTALAESACAAWPAEREGALRLNCTRGSDHTGAGPGGPTVWATISPIGADQRRDRRTGLAVVTADLGVSATAPTHPWLLRGAKTLSYAVNMAARRWAVEQGYDEMLWLSSDGYALEAPTASLVWLDGQTLCTVPSADTGILPGITAAWLLRHADELGLRAAERMIRPAELLGTQGVWLASSVRGLAEVRSLDRVDLPASVHTEALLKLLGFEADPE